MYVCVHTYANIHIYIYIYVHLYFVYMLCAYIAHTHTHADICVYIYICMCVYIYIYMYTGMYVCIHKSGLPFTRQAYHDKGLPWAWPLPSWFFLFWCLLFRRFLLWFYCVFASTLMLASPSATWHTHYMSHLTRVTSDQLQLVLAPKYAQPPQKILEAARWQRAIGRTTRLRHGRRAWGACGGCSGSSRGRYCTIPLPKRPLGPLSGVNPRR